MQFVFDFDSSIESFLSNVVCLCNTHKRQDVRDNIFDLFQILVKIGFSYYRLLAKFSMLDDISNEEIRIMISLSPPPEKIQTICSGNVRAAISRWTATKYHSGPIDTIIKEIVSLVSERKKGIYVYNSNLNPKSRRNGNDLYLLLIDDTVARWYDINRQATVQFVPEGEDICVKDCIV